MHVDCVVTSLTRLLHQFLPINLVRADCIEIACDTYSVMSDAGKEVCRGS